MWKRRRCKLVNVFKPEITGEGNAAARLLSLMATVGYNEGGNLYPAFVTSDYPDIKIQLSASPIEIPAQGIVVNPDLIARTETVKINGVSSTIEYPNKLVKGAKVWVFEADDRQLSYVLMMNNVE